MTSKQKKKRFTVGHFNKLRSLGLTNQEVFRIREFLRERDMHINEFMRIAFVRIVESGENSP